MLGKKTKHRKLIYAPDSLVRHIQIKMKELPPEGTYVEAMEKIANDLDELIIKKKRLKKR